MFTGTTPATLDELVERLRTRRAQAMSPSFSEIARRVSSARAARGVPASDRSPGRVTVYDCFRTGRRRLDIELVLDIVAALGADESEISQWRRWCLGLQPPGPRAVVTARSSTPVVTLPHAPRRLAERVRTAGTTLVVGMPGVGKTQLAAAALGRMAAADVVSEVITIDVRGSDQSVPPVHARAILDGIARTLGSDVDERVRTSEYVARIVRALAVRRIGVLLDDVGRADQVRALVRGVTRTPLVVTSRLALDVCVDCRIEVPGWDADEAVGFLALRVGADRVAAEPDAARAIAELTGGLPLAMSLAATRIQQQPRWSLRDHADALRTRLAGLQLDDDVSASLLLSYQSLTAGPQRALRMCAVQPVEQLPAALVAAVLDCPPREADEMLTALADAHLIARGPAGEIGMHALVRTFAEARSLEEDPQARRNAAVERLAAAYVSAARDARPAAFALDDDTERRGHPMDAAAASAWYAAEIGNLIEVASAVTARRPDLTVAIADVISPYIESQSMFRAATGLFHAALECAKELDDPRAVADAEYRFGHLLVRRGGPGAERHLHRAIEIARAAGLPRTAVRAYNSLAVYAGYQGDVDAAITAFRHVKELAVEAGFEAALGTIDDNIGVTLRHTGDLAGATEHHRAAIAFAHVRGDAGREGGAMSNLSEVCLAAGDVAEAIALARAAIELTREVALGRYAHALTNLGNAEAADGQLTAAREHHEEALTHATIVGEGPLVAYIHNNLAACLHALGDDKAARAEWSLARSVAESADIRFERARALVGLAVCDTADGATESARTRLHEAIAAFGTYRGGEPNRARRLLADLS
ncbi:tetratricopeptide repeat protein [Microbacterium sp.]|uniref:tetratricopeptide repeat protein n=1 Tax=Microbacterium sp. TaxID=51671 RepID=UPI003A868732